MAWKYLNPGDYRLLHKYNSSYCKNYQNKTVAPVTGFAFGASENNSNYPINLPAGCKEIWAAFTWVNMTVATNWSYMTRVEFRGASTLDFAANFSYESTATWESVYINNSNKLSRAVDNSFCSRIWLHVKSGTSDGAAEIYRNGQQIYSASNINVMKGEDILLYSFHVRYTNNFVSDIIFSDEPIAKDEHVAVLPITNTSAEGWTYDAVNNIYTADSAGKTIWQVPDINQLKAVTGLDNPSVTAVAVQAYNVSTNDTSQVDTLQKSVKQNGQTVITDSADISSATAVISPAMTINPVTNAAWTLNDLANLQLGITTAKSA